MAILKLESNNPRLGYIISKNPNAIPQVRSIRKGVAFGWFPKETEYVIYFKDQDDEISFKQFAEQEYEYLTLSKFNYSYAYNSLINEFLYSSFKSQSEHDNELFDYSIEFNMVHIRRENSDLFQRYFKHISFEINHLVGKNYNVKLSIKSGTLFDLMNVAVLYLFMNSMWNNENIFIENELVKSYINIMRRVKSPYFIRYVFKSMFFRDSQSNPLLDELNLDTPNNEQYVIEPFDIHTQRRNFLTQEKFLSKSRPVIDLGCGEGFYTLYLAKRYDKFDQIVHAVDIDKNLTDFVAKKAQNKELDNVVVYNSIQEAFGAVNEDLDVLCSEVIEHMEVEESTKLIKTVLKNPFVKSAVFSTPNKDFNKFYDFDTEDMRHDDHKWEMGFDQFKKYITDTFSKFDFNIEFFDIGDSVNGIKPTIGVWFWK